jgi:hypothetical protein
MVRLARKAKGCGCHRSLFCIHRAGILLPAIQVIGGDQ